MFFPSDMLAALFIKMVEDKEATLVTIIMLSNAGWYRRMIHGMPSLVQAEDKQPFQWMIEDAADYTSYRPFLFCVCLLAVHVL